MQKMYVAFVFFTLFGAFVQAQENAVTICFDEKCSIKVDGESNVSPFSCQMVALPISDQPIPVKSTYNNGKLYMNNVKVKLPVSSFKCANQAMTSDFQKALKEKDFPFVTLYFSHLLLPFSPNTNKSQKNVPAQISFSIAGVQRKYDVVFEMVEFENEIMKITGLINLKMSDFKIEPPQALFGMIKAKDAIGIQFVLQFCMNKS